MLRWKSSVERAGEEKGGGGRTSSTADEECAFYAGRDPKGSHRKSADHATTSDSTPWEYHTLDEKGDKPLYSSWIRSKDVTQ